MIDLSAVQARIAQLQSTLGTLPAVPARSSGAAGTATGTTASGRDFASALASAAGGTSTARAATGGSSSGSDAVNLARSFTGVPYRWGGTDPATGLDCSGLVKLVYSRLGVQLPRVAADQSRMGTAVPSLDQARPGDLVFFGSPAHHVGIYAGEGKMIDAPHTGSSVGLHRLWGTPSAIRRLLPDATATATTPAASAVAAASATTTGTTGGLAGVPYGQLFAQAGARHGVDPALLAAVAKAESGYEPRAVSGAGAQGLMQLMPSTARSLGVDALDPAQAVDGSARLLKDLLGRFGGRVDLALAGYNAGPGAVQRHGGVPPYAETRTYVNRVTSYWEALR